MVEEGEAVEARRAPRERGGRLARVRKLHSLTGVLPLGMFLVFHAWQQAPVRGGRDLVLARLHETGHGILEALAVLLPLLFHAGSGVWLARNVGGHGPARQASPYPSAAFRRFQALTGIVVALFLAFHVGGTFRPWLEGGRAFAAYGAMLDQTGTLPGAAAYVVGLSATCVHFGQGLSVFVLRWWPRCSPRLARGLGVLVGLGLWLTFLDELAVYATGASLIM